MSEGTIEMRLDDWRGFSAYEVAVRNGFEGSEKLWLASLNGKDGKTTSVNGVVQIDGNIALSGANVPVKEGESRTLQDAVKLLDMLAEALSVSDTAVNLGGRYLDNALFR